MNDRKERIGVELCLADESARVGSGVPLRPCREIRVAGPRDA